LCVSDSGNAYCSLGSALASYSLDAPAQLVEFTFDALDPNTGNVPSDADSGIPMVDIDISYVDQLYLPVALTVDDQGASRYMGTILNYETFNKRVSDFVKTTAWPSLQHIRQKIGLLIYFTP
jgi:hypothetical protein